MSKIKRIIRIMLALNNNNSITAKELAKAEGVSERTILRDIQELSEIYFPVYSERGRNGGFSTLKNKMIPPIWFSEDEIIAIFFAIDAMQYVGSTPFSYSYEVILNKLFNMIPQETTYIVEKTRNKVLMWQPNIKVDEKILRILYEASVEMKTIHIVYAKADIEEYREIEPIGLYIYNGYWYCPSYCKMRKSMRLFRVDRIKEATMHSQLTNMKLNVKEWLYAKHKSPEIKLEVYLSKEGRRKAESLSWLRADIECNPDGTAKISKNISSLEEEFYVDMLWSIGDEVEVIEPKSVKNKLIERACSLLKKYN